MFAFTLSYQLIYFISSFIYSFTYSRYVTFVLQLQLLLLTHHSSVYLLVTLLYSFSLLSSFSYPIFTTALVFIAIFIFVFVSIFLFCSYNKCHIFYYHILLLFTLSFSVSHLYFRFDLYSSFIHLSLQLLLQLLTYLISMLLLFPILILSSLNH